VVAKLNQSAAITDKLGTTVTGGLINTVTMELREAGSETVTAGISGIQNGGNGVALWAGGTYAEAIAGTAKAIIRHDGTSKFSDTEIEGKITATSGAIGGFTIASGRLGVAQSGDNPTNNGMSLYNEFIKFSNAYASVFLGTNVLPGTTGTSAMMRLINNHADGYGSKWGAIISVSGNESVDGSNPNIAVDIQNGVVNGFRMQVRPVNINNSPFFGAYTFGNETVLVVYASNTSSVTLPSNPQVGDIRYIIGVNNHNVLLIGSSSRQIKPGHASPVNSVSIIGQSCSYPGSKFVIWDGSFWQLLSI